MARDPLNELSRCLGGTAGGDEVVADQNPLPGCAGVDVDFKLIDAVFKAVADGFGLVGQFALFADRDEANPELQRQRGAKDEAPTLHAGDHVDLATPRGRQGKDDILEGLMVLQQRGDVPKENARFGEVRDPANQALGAFKRGGKRGLGRHADKLSERTEGRKPGRRRRLGPPVVVLRPSEMEIPVRTTTWGGMTLDVGEPNTPRPRLT